MAASYSAATSGTVIDTNHQYYLHPSYHPGMILITVTLSDQNYTQWSRSMKIALSSKLKLGFIDGTCPKPASTSTLLLYWNRCNDVVISWLMNTISSEIRQSVMYMSTAQAFIYMYCMISHTLNACSIICSTSSRDFINKRANI